MPDKNRRQGHAKRPRIREWIVCAVLGISLWHGPVPWIHTHDADSAAGESIASLAWHLRHYHPFAFGHRILGWHVHWTMPWDVFHAPCSGGHSPALQYSAYEMPFVSTHTADFDPGALRAVGVLPSFCCERPAQDLSHRGAALVFGLHFLQTFPPSVALRALICVALC